VKREGFLDIDRKVLIYNLYDLDFGAAYHVDIAFYTLTGKFSGWMDCILFWVDPYWGGNCR
jgi:hypothetical protein